MPSPTTRHSAVEIWERPKGIHHAVPNREQEEGGSGHNGSWCRRIGGVSITENGDDLVITGSPEQDFISITSAPAGMMAIQVFAGSGHLLGEHRVSEFAGDLTVDLGNNDDNVVV